MTATGQLAVTELVDALPAGVVVTDAERMEKYRMDRAFDPAAGHPVAVVRAESTEHVQTALRWASAHGVAVVPRGAGSGLSGGSTAVDGGIVVTTERMRTIEVDPATRIAVVEPGAAQRRGEGGRRRARPVVPAGSVVASRSAPSAATWPPTPAGCAA